MAAIPTTWASWSRWTTLRRSKPKVQFRVIYKIEFADTLGIIRTRHGVLRDKLEEDVLFMLQQGFLVVGIDFDV